MSPSSPSMSCLLLLGGLAPLSACDSCGCHMPSDFTPDTAGLSVGVFEQYTDFGTLRSDGREVDNTYDQYLRSSTTQLIIGWNPQPWLKLSAFVPYISRSYSRPDFGTQQTGTVAGLGDSTLLAAARVINQNHPEQAWIVSLLGGVKIPTGDPSQLRFEYAESQGQDLPGDNLDPNNATGGHDLALGSGAWDAIGGASTSCRMGIWYVAAQATYTYNSEGAYTYRYANEIAAVGSLGCFWYVHSPWRAWAQVNLDGDSKGLDSVAGQKTDDTANHNLYAGPELSAMWDRRLIGDLSLDVPVEQHNSSTQLVPTWRGRVSVSYRF